MAFGSGNSRSSEEQHLVDPIARARSWMNDLSEGLASPFEEIARSENKVERHSFHSPSCRHIL